MVKSDRRGGGFLLLEPAGKAYNIPGGCRGKGLDGVVPCLGSLNDVDQASDLNLSALRGGNFVFDYYLGLSHRFRYMETSNGADTYHTVGVTFAF